MLSNNILAYTARILAYQNMILLEFILNVSVLHTLNRNRIHLSCPFHNMSLSQNSIKILLPLIRNNNRRIKLTSYSLLS